RRLQTAGDRGRTPASCRGTATRHDWLRSAISFLPQHCSSRRQTADQPSGNRVWFCPCVVSSPGVFDLLAAMGLGSRDNLSTLVSGEISPVSGVALRVTAL